jgi:origin recognition complex subunit 2
MGLGLSLLRGDNRDARSSEEDGESGEEDDVSEGDPAAAFDDVVARYTAEADAAGAAERASRRKQAAAGGAYFASRRRAAASTASLAELDLAGAARGAARARGPPTSPALFAPRRTRPHLLRRAPPADEGKIRALLNELEVGHLAERTQRAQRYDAELFPRWRALLHAGFSLLVYGFGSKKALLDEFAHNHCRDGGVAVVNGFFPELKVRQLLATAAAALSPTAAPASFRGRGAPELLAHIAAAAAAGRRLYVFVNSVDGAALRGGEALNALASLAAIPRVHLVASADHVNAALLWPKRAAAQLRWAWEHAPTFAPYVSETAAVPQILAARGEARLLRGAANVLRILTPNARAIFRVLAEEHLAHPADHGLSLARLYTLCREQFLVASETTLKAHLTEYFDHQLVKRVKRPDGAELIAIAFGAEDIQQLLDDIEAAG